MGTTTFSGPVKTGTVREGASANTGFVLTSQTNTLAYTDTTAKTLFILPAYSQIISINIDVTTVFNSSGTDLVDVGTSGTANLYWNDAVVSALSRVLTSSGTPAFSEWASVGASDVTVTATYIQSVADATTGAARITFVYAQKTA